jgi:hypothetical protein
VQVLFVARASNSGNCKVSHFNFALHQISAFFFQQILRCIFPNSFFLLPFLSRFSSDGRYKNIIKRHCTVEIFAGDQFNDPIFSDKEILCSIKLFNSRQKQHSSFLFSYSFHRKNYPVFIVILHKIDEYDISLLIETFSVPN